MSSGGHLWSVNGHLSASMCSRSYVVHLECTLAVRAGTGGGEMKEGREGVENTWRKQARFERRVRLWKHWTGLV